MAAVEQLAVEPRADTRFQAAAAGGRLRALIELTKQGWVEHVELNDRSWPVLVHEFYDARRRALHPIAGRCRAARRFGLHLHAPSAGGS